MSKIPPNVNDPKNFKPVKKVLDGILQEETQTERKTFGVSRRNFLKWGGVTAATATVVASAGAGFAIGTSSDGYTGYGRNHAGDEMFFNRKPFQVEIADVIPNSLTERPKWWEQFFERLERVTSWISSGKWNPNMGLDTMPGEIGDFYRANPDSYQVFLKAMENQIKQTQAWNSGLYKRYIIADAYTHGYRDSMYNGDASTVPEDPGDSGKTMPPEIWDFRNIPKYLDGPVEFKSKKHASALIKRIAHAYGSTLVGIAPFDKRFMFRDTMRGMPNKGHTEDGEHYGDKVPEHWKSVIVVGFPMYWDSTYAAIGYSTSYDGYFGARVAAGCTERFLNQLGYAARAQFPGAHYEMMAEPYMITSGIGEYSRSGLVVTPELGGNFRVAMIITDLEFEYDKPIKFGVERFCEKCKICADTCPSGAIETTDKPQGVVRGVKRWILDQEKCHLMWRSGTTSTGDGCRVCIAVCPYTKKNTWIHTIARQIDPRDPTGLVTTGLLAMQQNFFKYPEAEEFKAEWDGGIEATYHNPPKWLRPEEYLKIDKTWQYHGID